LCNINGSIDGVYEAFTILYVYLAFRGQIRAFYSRLTPEVLICVKIECLGRKIHGFICSLNDRFTLICSRPSLHPCQISMVAGLQVLQEEIPDALLHVNPIFQPARHVALVREEQQFVGLAGRDQGVDQASRVAEVDVLVDQTVNQQ
jgi:hypothetical protein